MKDCGLCGFKTCEEYGKVCPYQEGDEEFVQKSNELDYDFVLRPYPGEVSARKFIVPFRADLVEKWNIVPGQLVIGRPAGPGCPVQHVLRVISANRITGVLECFTVGPQHARKEISHDIQCYHVHAFEGLAQVINREPTFGLRQRFLPSFCMMQVVHTAVVNLVIRSKQGLLTRLEDIRIL